MTHKKTPTPAPQTQPTPFEIASIAAALHPPIGSEERAIKQARRLLLLASEENKEAVPNEEPSFLDVVESAFAAEPDLADRRLRNRDSVPFDALLSSLMKGVKKIEQLPRFRRWLIHTAKIPDTKAGQLISKWQKEGVPRPKACEAWESFSSWYEEVKHEGKKASGRASGVARGNKKGLQIKKSLGGKK